MDFMTLFLKDLTRAFRSVMGVAMTFAMPLLITAIIAFAFGGFTSGEPESQIQAVPVAVANLDKGSQGMALGAQLVGFLGTDDHKSLIALTEVADEPAALAAVKDGSADVAMVIPSEFSQAVLLGTVKADVSLTNDPAASFGPPIVRAMVSSFVDAFNGAGVARDVSLQQLSSRSLPAGPDTAAAVMFAYADWAGKASTDGGGLRGITTQAPPARGNTGSGMTRILALIMAGQMVFFGFWTAANNTLSLLAEQEGGTLARLFTTPTNRRTILASKFALVAIFGLIQVIVLVVISSLVLHLRWGSPAAVAFATIGLIAAGGGFGIFIISLLKNTRQAGSVLGGLLTVLGMISGLFTVGFANPPAALNLGGLLTPHGWVMRLWKSAIDGAPLNEAVLPLLICLAMGAVFFAAGYRIFSRRFA